MLNVSQQFKDAFRDPRRRVEFKATVNGLEYGPEQIVELSVTDRIQDGSAFTIGTVASSELVLSLRTTDEIPVNAEVRLYLRAAQLIWDMTTLSWVAADTPWNDASSESIPYGVYYIDKRKQTGDYWQYTCLDAMVLAEQPFISRLAYPASMAAVLAEACELAGIESEGTVAPSLSFAVAPTGYSCRGVISLVASASASCARMNKTGRLSLAPLAASAPVETIRTGEYGKLAHTNPIKSITRVVCAIDDEGAVLEAGSGSADHTVNIHNPYLDQAGVDGVQRGLNGFVYHPFTMDWTCLPWLDVGDRITVQEYMDSAWNRSGTAWNETAIPWNGIGSWDTTIMTSTITYRGGLSGTISAASDSQQQSEFKPVGTLTQAVNNLSKAAVKLAKPYYGVIISREQGLLIEKSDKSSKAVLNSDELTFYKGNEKALWFDVPNDSYMFSGTITASTINGTEINGGSIQIGTAFSVNNAGHMKAAGAEFSGTIEASIITGGQINGSNINGGVITGGLIRTAASGPRIEFSSAENLLRAFNSTGATLSINSNLGSVPTLEFKNHSDHVQFFALSNVFSINANKTPTKITIAAGKDIHLNPGGDSYVTIPSWHKLLALGNGISLGNVLDDLNNRIETLEKA